MFWMRGNLSIRGAEYRPAGFDEKNRYKAVIISHGFTGNYSDNDWFARKFAGLTAVLEHAQGGSTVRIYSDIWPLS